MNYQEFKPKFVERYEKLTNIEKFRECSILRQKKSIRVNTLKISVNELKERIKHLKLKQIPWCKEGFLVESERTDLGNLEEHGLGYFYVQEASSMVPAEVLNPLPEDFVLDMAAAPGSKTTQIAAKMENKGYIIANDPDYLRQKPLTMNIQRCGIMNVLMTTMEGKRFEGFNFDKILLDAPCSGTGTISKSPRTILEWNPYTIKRLAGIQKQLIITAFNNLKENGTLVYSTCTLEPEEDEGIISYLLENNENAKLEKIELDIKSSKPVLEFNNEKYNSEVKKCLRIWPQDNNTDGFFVAKIRKI
ncbi:NOL1/NOP2/sun family putative RNA methylase [Candidatus Woesearchaeota archaeon]|nr:NOL1/NOP2/sun family putative RNA methylase [Candidatus Woesearchaeota archaeon]